MSNERRIGFHPRNRSRLLQAAVAAALVMAVAAGVKGSAAAEPLLTPFSIPYLTGPGARAVAMGDVNGDGKQDVVTVTADGVPGTVSVLLGVGDGTLQAHTDYPAGFNLGAVTLADLNSDGRSDVIAASDSFLCILLANGDGSLQPVHAIPNRGWRIGDVNGDGKLDLVGKRDTTISVRLGIGDGTFAAATVQPIGADNGLEAVGDLNGDGRLDLIVNAFIPGTDTTDASRGLRVMLGNGDGSFTPGFTQVVYVIDNVYQDYRTTGVIVGDVSGDGALDVAYGGFICDDHEGCYAPFYGVLIGNGDGTFRTSGGGGGRPLLAADLDGNGVADVLSSDDPGHLVLALRQLDGSSVAHNVPVYTPCVAVGDLNEDGHLDMVAAGFLGNTVAVLIGNGNGTFGSDFERPLGFSPTLVASGDLNGDGRTDLVALQDRSDLGGDGYDGPAAVLLDDGNGGLAPTGHADVGAALSGITLGYLNGDAHLDLAVTNGYPGGVWVLMGDGAGGFGPKMLVPGEPWTVSGVAIGDFNGDGLGDLVVSDDGVSVLLGNGDGTFSPPSHYANASGPVQIGDFNRDGVQDLAFGDPAAQAVSVMLGDGTGGFLPRADFAIGQVPGIQAMGDLNGDGNIDLLATTGSSVLALLGDGHGNFNSVLTTEVHSGIPQAIGDLNNDGAEDVAFASGGWAGILLGAGDGTFGSPILFGTGGARPRWVGITDRNGDGRADLTVMSGGFMRPDDSGDYQTYSGVGAAVSVLFQNGPSNPLPPAPIPSFAAPTTWRPDSIVLGQTFTITVNLRNNGATSDDGRLSVSFPSFTGPSDGQWVSASAAGDVPGYAEVAAGMALSDSTCNGLVTSYLATEYADTYWRGLGVETNTVTLTVQPQAAGPFYFYVRGTMHTAGGAACDFVNSVPGAGEPGFTDQQGWAVRRFAVTVLPPPPAPAPVFTAPVAVVGDSLALGDRFSISVRVRNDGAASDDGRIVVGFPSFTDPADSALVSSTSVGDSPGYREFPSGAMVTDSTCQSAAAAYLAVEYADSDWQWLGTETDTLTLTVQPRAVGTFFFDVRSTMRVAAGPGCQAANATLAGGVGGITDPQGWSVHRFAITVLPPRPEPIFTAIVTPSPAATITLGLSFTLTASVTNAGPDTDDGRIVFSFPGFTATSDSQRVSLDAGGDDGPGYREWPAGSLLQRSNCSTLISYYLAVEYADSAWAGGGAETNQLALTVTPKAVGAFPVYVRSTMHWVPQGPCAYVDGIPATLAQTVDQQGRVVGVVWVQVLPPEPPPVFSSAVFGSASITLGESFIFTATVQNSGRASDDGRIILGFPTLAGATDGAWVSSGSVGDLPGYLEHPAGSSVPDSACHDVSSSYLTAEYADSAWASGETNTVTISVQPQVGGTFYVDVRCTLRDVEFSGGSCGYVNGLPIGGSPVTDPQGWTVRRFAITVYGPEGPLPPPSIAWEQIPVPVGGPSARSSATAIYHPGRHAMILYGGQSPVDYLGDVWSLPLAPGGAWSQITPGGPTPIRRIMQSMILSPLDDQLVIFGGYYDSFLNDATAMTLTGQPWWFPNTQHGTPPSRRGGHTGVYDPVRNRMLVIGGFGDVMMNDVWECAPPSTGTWRQIIPIGDPMPGRLQAAAVYDPVRDRVLIFGGDSGPFLNDVWALNLSGEPTWEQLHPVGNAPSPRREHSAIYDPVGDRVILYGGFDADRQRRSDVWALNLANGPEWSFLVSSTPPPASRCGHVAVYDPLAKRMVIFGGQTAVGQYSREVWALNLDTLTPVAVSLASAEVQSDLVRITWSAEGAASLKATVERTEGASGEWTDLGSPTLTGSDHLVFEDRGVVAGTRYGYRLVIAENGSPTITEPAWVTVPVPAILSLAGASPNPSQNGVSVRFSLPGSDAAALELFDLKGRRIAAREVGTLGPGEHLVPLSERLNLAAGVYLVRLTQGHRTLTAKACVVK